MRELNCQWCDSLNTESYMVFEWGEQTPIYICKDCGKVTIP